MIVAEGLTVRYRRGFGRKPVEALTDLSLHVRRGDCYALVGANGAGKTTALFCFLGLLRPQRGRVVVLGSSPGPGAEVFRRIGYVPEEPHYHLHLTVREALDFYGSLLGQRPPKSRIDELLERLDLTAAADRPLAKCSKGMRQKFGIASCLMGRPELLLLDEPTRGLDPFVAREFRAELERGRAAGITIVMNTHLLAEVEQLATRIALIDRGRLLVEDEPRNLTLMEEEVYDLEIAGDGAEPPLPGCERKDGAWHAATRTELLRETLGGLEARGFRLLTARLRRRSLEQSLWDRVRRGAPDA